MRLPEDRDNRVFNRCRTIVANGYDRYFHVLYLTQNYANGFLEDSIKFCKVF